MDSIRPAIEELERAFHELKSLFKTDLPLPVITIQNRGRKKAAAWFAHRRWTNRQEQPLPEINICAESLARSVEDIAATLLHEMVHYANTLDGISDCTTRQYHNEKFKNRCLAVGLTCTKTASRGWSQTALSPGLKRRVEGLGLNQEAFTLFRNGQVQKKAPTKMKKWSCGCTNIRAAVEVDAVCQKCGGEFKH